MNREIKFRAMYSSPEGFKWAHGLLAYMDSEVIQIFTRERNDQKNTDVFNCIPGTEGQFTGLRDKNGNEIYEGDVVRFPLLDNRGGHPVVVEWKDAGWNWLNIHYTGGLEVEVIGNIHENPELLNQTEP